MFKPEEFEEIEATAKADARFIAACQRRGIDVDAVCVDPWSAGVFGIKEEEGLHISHGFCYLKTTAADNSYAHPIEGLHPVVDVKAMTVLRVDDRGDVPVPAPCHNFDRDFLPPPRSDLKPIEISQPSGVSFRLDGHALSWHEWRLVVGFNAREALTLHDLRFGGRPVVYRASLAEMVVPYGSPQGSHARKNVFDVGEYGVGNLVNELELGCDCVGAIRYLDAWVNDMQGRPVRKANAICIHEEDTGLLWKHFDFRTGRVETRRGRRLVLSCIATVGNYDYCLYWYLYLDGALEFEVKATGIINTAACEPGSEQRYGTEVAPGVLGHIHQHIFCARLDMAVDGDSNSVVECDTVAEEPSITNPFGNAYFVEERTIETECGRRRAPDSERYWKFVSAERTNAMGAPTAYKLEPSKCVNVFVHPRSRSGERMPFVRNHLWVTAFDPDERYPGGEHMHQSDGRDGVHAFAAKERSVRAADVVAWHVFGLHHLPRLEDWPVQPVACTGFRLSPSGFFDRNPTLDLPATCSASSRRADADG
ncbi:unnamed protein product [Ostreobium quekettii]|uniref:Amine oxidase n=1 Tax=Ostreobium quekettii TaxID=121088 RepID=A0A8S1J7B4_9CHLO|nr:unnamed protein product [Ostreobium quekettii]